MKLRLKKRVIKKRPKKGDIVYWCQDCGNAKFEVRWGMVDEVFTDGVYVDYLDVKEMRYIKPLWCDTEIFIDDFEDNKFHKLPKGWTYDTLLFEIKRRDFSDEEEFDLKKSVVADPEYLKELYKKGLIVKRKTKFYGSVVAKITKEGYRIVKEYPIWEKRVSLYTSLYHSQVYFNYSEAEKEKAEKEEEYQRQASLSDAEWSREMIEHDIERYASGHGYSFESPEIKRILDFFEGIADIEKIETRISGGRLQWKYEDKKRWVDVE